MPRNLQYGIVNVEACGGRRVSQLDGGTISWVRMANTVPKVRNGGRYFSQNRDNDVKDNLCLKDIRCQILLFTARM